MMQVRSAPSYRPRSDRYVHSVELVVFLSLFVPSLVLSLFATGSVEGSFALVAVATACRDLGLVALVLFFVWRNGETPGHIGWTTTAAGREVLLGVLLFVPMTVAASALGLGLRALGLREPTQLPSALSPAPGQFVLAVLLVSVVAVAEETIFRGYVLQRLRELTGSTTLAVVASSGLFALGHAYEGSAGVIVVGFLGVTFALVYLWRGSLVAPMTMHFCQDFIAIALVPTLAHGH